MMSAMPDRFAHMPSTAEEWVARMQSRPLSPAESAALEAWLAADPANREEYANCNHVGTLGDHLRARPDLVRAMPAYAMLHAAQPCQARRRWLPAFMALAGGAVCVGLLSFLLLPRLSSESAPETIATIHGQQRVTSLDDGSQVHLNTESVIRVAYSERERRVELASGEAFFEVTHDRAGRPFVVRAGATEVRVVGTKFSVRATNGRTDVVVSEGKVEVVPDISRTAPAIPAKVELVPGNVLRIDRQAQLVQIAAANPERVASWRTGSIDFENATVEEVITEVNRYTRIPFVIADRRIADVRLSGTFKVGDTESVRFALKDGFNIDSVVTTDRIVLKGRD